MFIESGDNPGTLDLRILVGCEVVIFGGDEGRVRAVYEAAIRHKARHVIASSCRLIGRTMRQDFVLDSNGTLDEGVKTWLT